MKYTTPNIMSTRGIEPRGTCKKGYTCKSFHCDSGSWKCDSKFKCTSHSTIK